MKTALGAAAAVLLAGTMCTQQAHAQSVPQGSYLDSCTRVGMDGDRLIADCRRADGGWHRTVLDVNRCVGDIGNSNGSLQCNMGGRAQAVPAGPGSREPGYGSDRGGERCGGLRRQGEELRSRLDREFNPLERARIEGQLREVHEQQERCR